MLGDKGEIFTIDLTVDYIINYVIYAHKPLKCECWSQRTGIVGLERSNGTC